MQSLNRLKDSSNYKDYYRRSLFSDIRLINWMPYPTIMVRLYSEDKPGGPIPKFSDYHVWKTIMTIGKDGPIGRKTLSTALNIGEGSTRTILQNLQLEGFVEVNRSGAVLTRKGKEILRSSLIEVKPVDCGFLTIDKEDCAVKVCNAAHRVVSYGCDERDIAIRAGATGATTLLVKNDHLFFPGDKDPIEIGVEERLKQAFRLRNGDVILVGTGRTYDLAEKGAVTAALRLSGEMRKRKELGDILCGDSKQEDLHALALTIHHLCGATVCARAPDELGVRVEKGAIRDRSYTGPLLEEALKKRSVIEKEPSSGPFQGRRCRVVPLEVDGRILAVIGILLE